MLAPLTATSAVIGKEQGNLLPGIVGDLSAPDHTHSSSPRALYEQKLSWIFIFLRQTLDCIGSGLPTFSGAIGPSYAGSWMRPSENTASRTFVHKGKKKGRGLTAPALNGVGEKRSY